MGRRKHYDLVGSVYDENAKGNKYINEEIIKIPGVTFKSIADIDKFTAALFGSYDLKSKLDEKYQNKDAFAIRVTIGDDITYYKKLIFNNPDLIKIANDLKTTSVQTIRGIRTVQMYLGNNSLFLDAWLDVEKKIIEGKRIEEKREWLSRVFGKNSSYYTLITRYFDGDSFENNNLILELENAFRDYEVFRKYLTDKDKKIKKDKNNIISNINIRSTSVPVKTKLDVIEEKLGTDISYVPLDDEDGYDKEEFFDEKELGMMAGDGDVPHKFTGRII